VGWEIIDKKRGNLRNLGRLGKGSPKLLTLRNLGGLSVRLHQILFRRNASIKYDCGSCEGERKWTQIKSGERVRNSFDFCGKNEVTEPLPLGRM